MLVTCNSNFRYTKKQRWGNHKFKASLSLNTKEIEVSMWVFACLCFLQSPREIHIKVGIYVKSWNKENGCVLTPGFIIFCLFLKCDFQYLFEKQVLFIVTSICGFSGGMRKGLTWTVWKQPTSQLLVSHAAASKRSWVKSQYAVLCRPLIAWPL